MAAVNLRIDSIEQALRQAGSSWGESYAVAHAVAADNLGAGQTVVADCVNPWPLTRDEWRALVERMLVPVVEVEVVCSDQVEHLRRVEITEEFCGEAAPLRCFTSRCDYIGVEWCFFWRAYVETVGIRELKTHLSRHLKRVRSGACLLVTDRGRSIATISPVEAAADLTWASQLVAEGRAHWSGGKPTGARNPVSLSGKRSASSVVLEDRR